MCLGRRGAQGWSSPDPDRGQRLQRWLKKRKACVLEFVPVTLWQRDVTFAIISFDMSLSFPMKMQNLSQSYVKLGMLMCFSCLTFGPNVYISLQSVSLTMGNYKTLTPSSCLPDRAWCNNHCCLKKYLPGGFALNAPCDMTYAMQKSNIFRKV